MLQCMFWLTLNMPGLDENFSKRLFNGYIFEMFKKQMDIYVITVITLIFRPLLNFNQSHFVKIIIIFWLLEFQPSKFEKNEHFNHCSWAKQAVMTCMGAAILTFVGSLTM